MIVTLITLAGAMVPPPDEGGVVMEITKEEAGSTRRLR